jgi:hypothetical protein
MNFMCEFFWCAKMNQFFFHICIYNCTSCLAWTNQNPLYITYTE